MSHTTMNLNLKVWRQKNTKTAGAFEMYRVENISDEMSFLEMMDILNEQLITEGGEPVAFDHDCREGICGMCSMYINGKPDGDLRSNNRINYNESNLFLGDPRIGVGGFVGTIGSVSYTHLTLPTNREV